MNYKQYNHLLEREIKFVPGIYYSHITGKMFEAVSNKDSVKPKYVCGGHGPKVSEYIFAFQYSVLELYELLIPYEF